MNLKLLNSLVILKNAALNNKAKVLVLHTKDICKILELLYEEGVIQSFSKQTSSNRIYVHLRSFPFLNPLKNIKFMSKPSFKCYLSASEISFLSERNSLLIISTVNGYVTGSYCKKNNIGGKLLFIC